MAKLYALLLIGFLCIGLIACGAGGDGENADTPGSSDTPLESSNWDNMIWGRDNWG